MVNSQARVWRWFHYFHKVLGLGLLFSDLLKFTSSVSQAHSQLINCPLQQYLNSASASDAWLFKRTFAMMVTDMKNCRQNNLGLCRKMSPEMIFLMRSPQTDTSSSWSVKFVFSFEKTHSQSRQRNRLPDCRTKRRIKGHFVKEIRLPHSATPVFM